MGDSYSVFVIDLKGKRIIIDISHSETEFNEMKISEFKEKLLERLRDEPYAADDLRLCFGNVQLEDEKKFSDYRIQHESTILLILRLRGGGPITGSKSEEDHEQKEPLDHCGNTLQTVICTAAKPAFHQKIKKN
ncbi:uncharacterized protein LOC144483772 [Mustelus asterias]